ncbi:MAG: hypothetical protein PHD76_15080 [Methylacidiphilales bacterium]|nr:hypothetical protein [Candidatus Methylacidiphilales bacterium]
MKTKIGLLAACAALTLGVMNLSQAAVPVTDNLPGLPPQGAEYWKAVEKEQAAAQASAPAADSRELKADGFFYTGKPYVAELGAYSFQFRNYNPELQRWTTADPSGFPDGANNYKYTNRPTYAMDLLGLLELTTNNPQTKEFNDFSMWGGFCNFNGSSSASTSGNTGSVTLEIAGAGKKWLGDGLDQLALNLTLDIKVNKEGNLTYTRSGDLDKTEDSVSSGYNVQITGDNTKTLTVRINAGWALKASSISGMGIGEGGGSISFSDTSYSQSFAFGDFVFNE